MDRQEIISELRDIIDNYLKDRALDLVDLIYRYEGRGSFLRILVDRPEGGISLAECANLNNEISMILDEKDILKERYILEVYSPGLDRTLSTKNDFLRCINRKVRFWLSEPINGKIEMEGSVTKVDDDSVYVDIKDEAVKMPLLNIKKAKQIIDMIGD